MKHVLRDTRHEIRVAQQGFTLIEVILAVAILSVGLTVLLTSASKCLQVMKQSRNYQTAQWVLGMGEVDHFIVSTNDIEDIEVAPVGYLNGFTFSRTVEDDENEDGLYVVRTRASWSQRGKEPYQEVVHYVLRIEEE